MPNKNPSMYWDAPWSLVEGCSPCSPGCAHCWSAAMVHRLRKEGGLTDPAGAYNGLVKFRQDRLDIPWRRKKPTVYAVWTDPFHEAVSDEDIYSAFEVMFHCPQHTFLLLTKRAERMMRLSQHLDPVCGNIWFGVTACNQAEADQKIPLLLQTHAVHRYVSVEPMLEFIDFWNESTIDGGERFGPQPGIPHMAVDWVICGPENGPGRRPFDPAWAISLAGQCKAAGVPFFCKGAVLGLPRELPWR